MGRAHGPAPTMHYELPRQLVDTRARPTPPPPGLLRQQFSHQVGRFALRVVFSGLLYYILYMDARPPDPDNTYRRVQVMLWYWMTFLLLPSLFSLFFPIFNLSSSVRYELLFSTTSSILILLFLSAAISWLAVWLFELHKLYDDYFVGWRRDFEVYFIIGIITQFINLRYKPLLFTLAMEHRDLFLRPYYQLVGDMRSGLSVATRNRFYDELSRYWITQLTEVTILISYLVLLIYLLLNNTNYYLIIHKSIYIILILGALYMITRRLALTARYKVQKAEIDVIESILSSDDNRLYLEVCYSKILRDIGCAKYAT